MILEKNYQYENINLSSVLFNTDEISTLKSDHDTQKNIIFNFN